VRKKIKKILNFFKTFLKYKNNKTNNSYKAYSVTFQQINKNIKKYSERSWKTISLHGL
jgi:hypothetical protein